MAILQDNPVFNEQRASKAAKAIQQAIGLRAPVPYIHLRCAQGTSNTDGNTAGSIGKLLQVRETLTAGHCGLWSRAEEEGEGVRGGVQWLVSESELYTGSGAYSCSRSGGSGGQSIASDG